MAKGDVVMKFDANTSTFVSNVLKARQELLAAADNARKFGDEAAKAGDKAEHAGERSAKGFEFMRGAAEKVAPSMLEVTTALGATVIAADLVKETITNSMERSAEKANDLRGKILDLNAALAAGGQSKAAPEVREKLEEMSRGSIGGREVIPQEAYAAYGTISRNLGAKADTDTKLKATHAAMLARAGQMDEAGATDVGVNFAQLARERKPGGGFEGYNDEQLQDLAHQVTTIKPGGLSDKDLRFLARSKDKKQAIGLLFGAAQSDESARALSSIQQAAEEDISPGEVAKLQKEKRKMGAKAFKDSDAERKLRLSQIPQDQRMGAMLDDATLAPQADRLALHNLAEGMRRVPEQQSLSGLAQQAQSSAAPGDALQRTYERAEAKRQRNLEKDAEDDLRKQTQRTFREEQFETDHPNLSRVPWVKSAAGRSFGLGAGELQDLKRSFGGGQSAPAPSQESEPESAPAKGERPGANASFGADHLDVLDKIHRSMERNNSLTAQQTFYSQTRNDRFLRNGDPGQA